MLFNSFEFLVFFPIVTIVFFVLPHKYRWLHLLVSSCIFYMAFIPIYILILFVTIIIDYIAGITIENAKRGKRKWFLIMSLVANIGVLAIFKYYNFFIENINTAFHLKNSAIPLLNIILPIGLSFHTFQAMSYTIEVYRGNQKPEKHLGIYALYVMFYPQLVAGPIERPQNLLPQFHTKQFFNYDNAVAGFRLILWGMLKKIVIADRLAFFTDPVFNHPHNYPGVTIAIAAIFFAFQIFCDFSGYSDIAIGTARVMGFKLMTNFNKPYHARSISEFWKRWHISLSTWFKDYLYISLGGNKVSVKRIYFNLFFVFLISGFWHGANWTFIIWGALHGFYLIFALITKKFRNNLADKVGVTKVYWLNNLLNTGGVFILVTLAWIFFRAIDIKSALYMILKLRKIPSELKNIFMSHDLSLLNLPVSKYFVLLSFSLIALMEIVHKLQLKFKLLETFYKRPVYFRWALYYCAVLMIIILGIFDKRSFIYFQF